MNRTSRLPILSLCLLFPVTLFGQANVTEERVLAESGSGENWFVQGGNFRGEHYSPLDQVNDGNVSELGLSWVTDLPMKDGTPTTPIVVDGVVYLGGASSIVVAIDAKTGQVLWTYDADMQSVFSKEACEWCTWISRANRGVAVWDGRVFATAADCRLIALDAKTGKEQWSVRTCDTEAGYSISDSPYVGGGKIYLGNAGSETAENNRGYVDAYDPDTGKLIWRFYIVPSHIPEENDTPALKMAAKTWTGDTLETVGGGGQNWNEMTYDPASHQLFFGTSSSNIYAHNKRSPDGGDNLFLSSVIAVNADTGEYNWHYQTVDKDSWDYNATMNIILADLTINSENRETVLIAPKNGFHYALDRHTGELLTAGKYAKVNWATHINMETGRPSYDPAAEYWDLPDGETTLFWPNYWGAHSWNPMAYHPGLRLSYIPVIDLPSKMDNQGNLGTISEAVVFLNEVDGKPHAPGKLVAFDPETQSIRWSVNHTLPYNGGLMTTGGNLVFQGNAEGNFVAYAADSGEELWSVQTGSAINAAPASYSIEDEQYILVPIGASGGLQFLYPELHAADRAKGPVKLMAFSLGGDTSPTIPLYDYPPLPDQPTLDASDETITLGAGLYKAYCSMCHGQNGISRFNGSIPDLRYANNETHSTWHGIVVGGAKASNGMPRMDISIEKSEAIRNYILSLSEEIRAGR